MMASCTSTSAAVDNKVLQLVDCVDEINHWMSAIRLKLNV